MSQIKAQSIPAQKCHFIFEKASLSPTYSASQDIFNALHTFLSPKRISKICIFEHKHFVIGFVTGAPKHETQSLLNICNDFFLPVNLETLIIFDGLPLRLERDIYVLINSEILAIDPFLNATCQAKMDSFVESPLFSAHSDRMLFSVRRLIKKQRDRLSLT